MTCQSTQKWANLFGFGGQPRCWPSQWPGAVIGNTIFGNPNDAASWIFGMPSIWAWQILWWALGVGMMWFLAYKMEMSILPNKEVSALVEDIGDKQVA